MTRERKLYYNTISALALQIITLICGFILPKQVLLFYGSEINGLVTSITRFLSAISLLEMGIGPIIRFNLYKPLVEKDNNMISKIIISSEKFYKRIAYIFLIYILGLIFLYPNINREFDFYFTASMIIIISVSTFAQYYFGIVYQVFLSADQKMYISSSLQIFTIIINTISCIILMKMGYSVHIVKLVTSVIFVIRPLIQNIYVRKKYNLNLKIKLEGEPIKQKWNGFAQHIAAVVNSEIDIILLTFFLGYQRVSIYSTYFLVVSGITQFALMSFSGIETYWGNIYAKNEMELLKNSFEKTELLVHSFITFLYTTTAILIAPFVSVYVSGIKDENIYYLPVLGIILTFAYGVRCLRLPYFSIIGAAGHYKKTQNGAFISAAINVLVSLVVVKKFGLVGIAVGTFLAMFYHTIYFVWHLKSNILFYKIKRFLMYMLLDSIIIILVFYFSSYFSMNSKTYLDWVIYAIKISCISLACTFLVFGVFHFKEIRKKLAF